MQTPTDPKEIAVLVEQLRHACSVALGDLLAHGMPRGVSTDKLLQAAIVVAEEYLAQAEAEEAVAAAEEGKHGESQVEYYCSACHCQVKSCNHTIEERETWRREAAFEPWQRLYAPGTYGLCPHCKVPAVTLFGSQAGRCYACGRTDERLVEKLKEQTKTKETS